MTAFHQSGAETLTQKAAVASTASLRTRLLEAPDLAPLAGEDHGAAPVQHPPSFDSHERIVGHTGELFGRSAATPRETAAVWDWLTFLRELRRLGARGQLAGVHSYAARTARCGALAGYARDALWNAPPALWRGAEDGLGQAEVRYLSLRYLRFHPDRLRVVIGEDDDGSARALATVLYDGQLWALMHDAPWPVLAAECAGFRPWLSLNERALRLHWRDDERDRLLAALTRMDG